MLPSGRPGGAWSTTAIARGMVVVDSGGRPLGLVARVYGRRRAAGGATSAGHPQAGQPAAPTAPAAPDVDALLEIRTGGRGRPSRWGKRIYLPASAVHDVRGMRVRLWQAAGALLEDAPAPPDLAGWEPRASVPVPIYRPLLEWR
jgi:hypothetical protein